MAQTKRTKKLKVIVANKYFSETQSDPGMKYINAYYPNVRLHDCCLGGDRQADAETPRKPSCPPLFPLCPGAGLLPRSCPGLVCFCCYSCESRNGVSFFLHRWSFNTYNQ